MTEKSRKENKKLDCCRCRRSFRLHNPGQMRRRLAAGKALRPAITEHIKSPKTVDWGLKLAFLYTSIKYPSKEASVYGTAGYLYGIDRCGGGGSSISV